MILVPIRVPTPREMEALRASTTSVTRHDFVVAEERGALFLRLGPALAAALSVPLEALSPSPPEAMHFAGRRGTRETLVEVKVWPALSHDGRCSVEIVAMSRDRIPPMLAIVVLSFVGMAVGFYGGFAAKLPPLLGGLLTCIVPFALALPYVALRRRSVDQASKALFGAFRALEASLVAPRS